MSISEPRPLDPENPAGPGTDIIPAHLAKTRVPKKRGPNTDAGREAVAMNAIRHGLASALVPIPGLEDPEEWQAFRQAVIDDRAPVGAVEEALVERIAQLFWRMNRVAPYEAELVAVARERVNDDFVTKHKWGRDTPPDVEARELIDAAEEATAAVGKTGDPAHFISEAAGHEFVAALVDEDDALANVPLPGFEEGLFNVPENEWAIGAINAAVRAMAAHLKIAASEMLLLVHERLAARIQSHGEALEGYLREKDFMTRERRLPPAATLIALMKYEAHLGRQHSQAMHDLEALQSRRAGRPIPVTNFHISTGS